MKVCVTGGAGFIGSNLTGKLLSMGNEVIVIDNLKTGTKENLKEFENNSRFTFSNSSILDGNLFDLLEGVDVVFHEAAMVDVEASIKNPEETFRVNVDGTVNLLDACVKSEVKEIIMASSCAVYSENDIPSKEVSELDAKSPYAESKIRAEKSVKRYSDKYGIKYNIMRYFNVYGPNQRMNSGYAAVIPKFITNALKGEKLTIYGDGSQGRDFVFVEDVVNANMLCLNRGVDGEIFNIGSGKEVTINQLAEKIIELTGSDSEIEHTDAKEEIMHSMADITLSKRKLTYLPSYPLEEGLKITIDWIKRNS